MNIISQTCNDNILMHSGRNVMMWKDLLPKMLIARTRHDEYQYEGIKVVDIADWLLDK